MGGALLEPPALLLPPLLLLLLLLPAGLCVDGSGDTSAGVAAVAPPDPEDVYAKIAFGLSPPSDTAVYPGVPFEVVVNISVPQMDAVPGTDIKVELFGHDVFGSSYTRFALYDPEWLLDPDTQFVTASSHEMNKSAEFNNNIYHSGIFTLESLTTSEAGNITLIVRAALIRSTHITSGSKYVLSAAATFGGGLYGWSDQSQLICDQTDVVFDFVGSAVPSATGKTEVIPVRGGDRVDVVLRYTNPFDNLTLQVAGTADKEDVFTLTVIETQTIGRSFGNCSAFASDVNGTTDFTMSPSGNTRQAASRVFGQILNCGGVQPRSATEDDQITLSFGVFTDGEAGDSFTLTVKVLLRDSIKLESTLQFTLTDTQTSELGSIYQKDAPSGVVSLALTSPAPGVPLDIAAGGHVTYDVTYQFRSRMMPESISARDPALVTDVLVLHDGLTITGTEVEPCGVTAGPHGESVSPVPEPVPITDYRVFPTNHSLSLMVGPVYFTGLMDYKSNDTKENIAVYRVTIKISETATKPSISVRFGDGEPLTAVIPLMDESKRPNATSHAFQMEGNITSTLPPLNSVDNTLHHGGVIGFNMTVFVPPGASYPDFSVVARRREAGDGQLRLCRATIVSVGANLPCTQYTYTNATVTATSAGNSSYKHPMPDTANIQLGSVCALPLDLENGIKENIIIANFVFQHLGRFGPQNTFVESNAPNPIYFNALVESSSVVGGFASQIAYVAAPSPAKLAAHPAAQPRKIWTSVRGGEPVRPGQTVVVDLNFKWTPGVMADAWWTVTTTDAEDQVKFCDMRVTFVGDNYACKQEAVYQRLIHYESYDSPESDYGAQNRSEYSHAWKMVTNLMRYANAGLRPTFADSEEPDQDTVTTSVALVIPTSSGATAAFDVTLNEVDFEWTHTVQIPVSTDTTAAAPVPGSLTFTVDSGNDWVVYPGVLKQFEVILDLEDSFERTVKIVLESADNDPKYDACCAYVTFVGENAPCVDAYNLEWETSKSSASLSGPDVLTFDMGRLCAVPLLPRHETSNQVKVTLGLRPRDDLTAGDEVGVTLTVLMDDSEAAAGQLRPDPAGSAGRRRRREAVSESSNAIAEDSSPVPTTTEAVAAAAPSIASTSAPSSTVPTTTLSAIETPPATTTTLPAAGSSTPPPTTTTVIATTTTTEATLGQEGGPLSLTFTVSSDEFNGANVTGEVIANCTSNVTLITITETAWLTFNATLPANSVGRLSLKLSGFSEHGRAAIVPTGGLRILSRGRNIPCFGVRDMNDTIELSSSMSNTHEDVLFLDIGYVTDTGMSMARQTIADWEEADDTVQFEAEFRFYDHPRTTHETPLPVTLEIAYSGMEEKATISQGLALKRLGTEMPEMEVIATTVEDVIYQPNQQVPVDIVVRHLNGSTADAINATVTLAVPPYVAFDRLAWTNFSELPAVTQRRHALLLSWPRLAVQEEVHLQLLLTVDPHNVRGYGTGTAAATTPVMLKATMFQRYGIPGKPSGMYPPPAKLWYTVATPTYITFDVNSAECYLPLGLASGSVDDCQISASSAADGSRLPHMARMQFCAEGGAAGDAAQNSTGRTADELPCKGTTGWSPEQRGGPFRHWHQVDFGNLTRVTGVVVASPPATRRVTQFRLQHSLTGVSFVDLTPVTPVNWSAQYSDGGVVHKVTTGVETRFVRFIVEEAEEGDDQYIGLQLEYLGCQLATDFPLETSCARQNATPSGSDGDRNRHFAVDTGNSYVYFCDFVQSRGRRVCFVSHDGTQWRRLTGVIERMVGFDETTGRIYAAGLRPDSLLWSIDGGYTWFSESKAELDTISQSAGFFAAQDVPSLTPDAAGFSGRTIGDWTASYHGLSRDGQLRARWSVASCTA